MTYNHQNGGIHRYSKDFYEQFIPSWPGRHHYEGRIHIDNALQTLVSHRDHMRNTTYIGILQTSTASHYSYYSYFYQQTWEGRCSNCKETSHSWRTHCIRGKTIKPNKIDSMLSTIKKM